MPLHLTPSEETVLGLIRDAGALTSRRVQRDHPRPNWGRLLDHKLLTEYRTDYGRVLGLGRAGHTLLAHRRQQAPYLMAPGSVADRAYQMDALKTLEREGYRLHHCEYKASSKRDAQGYRQFTDQITRMVVQAPRTVPPPPPEIQFGRLYAEASGYPSLFANIQGGGLSLAQLKRIEKWSNRYIHTWHHSVIVAVPDDRELRSFLRRLESRHRDGHETHVQRTGRFSLYIERVHVLIQPCPPEED